MLVFLMAFFKNTIQQSSIHAAYSADFDSGPGTTDKAAPFNERAAFLLGFQKPLSCTAQHAELSETACRQRDLQLPDNAHRTGAGRFDQRHRAAGNERGLAVCADE